MQTILVARHAESECSFRGIVNGEPNSRCPLTEHGEEQARAASLFLPVLRQRAAAVRLAVDDASKGALTLCMSSDENRLHGITLAQSSPPQYCGGEDCASVIPCRRFSSLDMQRVSAPLEASSTASRTAAAR